VEDPTGAVWTLLEAMNGECTDQEVIEYVLARHPDESPSAVRDALDTFASSGYVEDTAAAAPEGLSDRDRERYERSRRWFRWADLRAGGSSWEPQARLKSARVTVIGVGGTGGQAAMGLVLSGVGRVHCVDGDEVQLSNLNRQILFREADLGRSKAGVAVERLIEHNTDIEVTGERLAITGPDQLLELAGACDVLVICADRPAEIAVWANRVCVASGTPWVWAGYHGPQFTFSVFVPGQGPCYECVRAGNEADHRADGANFQDAEWLLGDPRANAVTAPLAGLGGSLAAHGAIALLTGIPPIAPGRVHMLNLVELDHRAAVDYEPMPDCSGCGSRAAEGHAR
jgi:molybdopterin/thiamine biosynthesis adenylyltransferase